MEIPQSSAVTFEEILRRSDLFPTNFPTSNNRIRAIAGSDKKKQKTIVSQALDTRVILHPRVASLIRDFLNIKKDYGTDIERRVYDNLAANLNIDAAGSSSTFSFPLSSQLDEVNQFIQRLIVKRPLAFFLPNDIGILRSGIQVKNNPRNVSGNEWLVVGKSADCKIPFHSYMSYNEMQISALVGTSTPSFFINNGSRNNCARIGYEINHEPCGVIQGLVGARFEKPNLMEWQHVMITQQQNVEVNGYGKRTPSTHNSALLQVWAKFYGQAGVKSTPLDSIKDSEVYYFPTYAEAEEYIDSPAYNALSVEERYFVRHSRYEIFNISVYKRRMRITADIMLLDANDRAQNIRKNTQEYTVNKRVFLDVVGLGLGVWRYKEEQNQWFVDAVGESIEQLSLPNVAFVHFSWVQVDSCLHARHGGVLKCKSGNEIRILFGNRSHAERIGPVFNKWEPDTTSSQQLLVTTYPWDSNSFPGNEYWLGSLSASGDPAAACFSTIPELQNPYINPFHNKIYLCKM
ncbi:hypothetical protein BB558_001623 [Smittium angustum]|uniref:Uncharacterized protein n=1 Tax=Smittium angustum TaxID=133377 RepID=A0A2U1JB99_SMIAN|nr:hypothetical protein BB558_001623 [Smittium angustum]